MKGKKAEQTTKKRISLATYREKRAYLADHCFLTVPGGGKKPKSKDILGKKEWANLMTLPTDVLLRTTDYLGPMVDDMLTQSYAWLRSLRDDPTSMPFMFEAALDTHDEFNAAPFMAAHGWYRQATAALRNALEAMTHAARYAVRNDTAGHTSWRAGGQQPKFGNSVDIIGAAAPVAPIEAALGGSGLFGSRPNGVMRDLYADVCRYAHSAPGFTHGLLRTPQARLPSAHAAEGHEERSGQRRGVVEWSRTTGHGRVLPLTVLSTVAPHARTGTEGRLAVSSTTGLRFGLTYRRRMRSFEEFVVEWG